jgi:hypothetical protein
MATILSITIRIDKRLRRSCQTCDRRYGGHMSTEITVRGTFTAFRPAERGIVHTTVAYEGPDMEPVYARVATDLAVLKNSVAALEEQGPVTPVAVADAGMLNTRPEGESQAAFLRAAPAGGGPVAELVPKHIEVSATVDARFVAEPTAGDAA